MNSNNIYNVFFCADLHLSHKNILIHQSERVKGMGLKNSYDIEGHDEYIIDTWLKQTKRGDHIYVLGDFIMANNEIANIFLNRLKSNGCIIHLIVGNHDKCHKSLHNMFESIDDIKDVVFKKTVFPFLGEDFEVVMCHYPMMSWNNKCRGSMMLYGHVHYNSPWIDYSDDLMLNVGIDNPLCCFKLFTLEQIYRIYKEKLNGLSPLEYVDFVTKKNDRFIR